MFATPAFAQTAGGLAGSGMQEQILGILPIVGMIFLFYFLIIRPQQKRAKEHQAAVNAVKRGDQVVLSSGVHGKIVRVEDQDVGVEIATGVTVKVRKTMIAEVSSRGAPAAANDAKV